MPPGFPVETALSAMKISQKNNLFEFGDLFFLRIPRTATGTSAAVMWVTCYFACHKVHTILPKHGHLLLCAKCYIDDIFGIWIGNKQEWISFASNISNFGMLKPEIDEVFPSKSINFLDTTLSIQFNKMSPESTKEDKPTPLHSSCF